MERSGKTLLITGFEPFGGETVNPSWEAVKALDGEIGSWRLVRLCLPVEFGRAARLAAGAADRAGADAILCVGLAGGRRALTPEAAALNLREARIPDNAGARPVGEPVVPGAREAYFTTLPARDMAAAIRAAGVPAELSVSAGAFVCNDVLFSLLHRYDGTAVRVGFVHVPFLPEQVRFGEPCLTLAQTVRGLSAAVAAL